MKKTVGILCVLGLLLCGLTGCDTEETLSQIGRSGAWWQDGVCFEDGWVYYTQWTADRDYDGVHSLWRAHPDGSAGEPLLADPPLGFCIMDGWLYYISGYIDEATNYYETIVRMRPDGGDKQTLLSAGPVEAEGVNSLAVADEWIYYTRVVLTSGMEEVTGEAPLDTTWMCRMRVDGRDNETLCQISFKVNYYITGQWIYYVGEDGASLWRMRPDGSDAELLADELDCPSDLMVVGDRLYYSTWTEIADEYTPTIFYVMDLKTRRSEELLLPEDTELLAVDEEWYYFEVDYQKAGEDLTVGQYRCRYDGSDIQKLTDDHDGTFLLRDGLVYAAYTTALNEDILCVFDPDTPQEKTLLPTPESPDWPEKTLDTAGNTDLPADTAPTDALVKQVCGQYWHYKSVYDASLLDMAVELGLVTVEEIRNRPDASIPVRIGSYKEALSAFVYTDTLFVHFWNEEECDNDAELELDRQYLCPARSWQPTVEHTVIGCTPAGERQVTVGGTDTVAYAYTVTVQAEGSAPTDYRMELVWQDGRFVVYSCTPSP